MKVWWGCTFQKGHPEDAHATVVGFTKERTIDYLGFIADDDPDLEIRPVTQTELDALQELAPDECKQLLYNGVTAVGVFG